MAAVVALAQTAVADMVVALAVVWLMVITSQ
jgi:hypothetical protein